jgi:hypothetical protein
MLSYSRIDKYQSHNTPSSSELTPSLREMTTAPQRWPVRSPISLDENLNSCFKKETHNTCRNHFPIFKTSNQSSWLQIRRPEFDSRHYQKKKVVGMEQGPLSLVSTTEELLDRKVAAPV